MVLLIGIKLNLLLEVLRKSTVWTMRRVLLMLLAFVHALLTIVASCHWSLFQMDVKNTFLNGDLSEEVYM
jgi:hypothetical protein